VTKLATIASWVLLLGCARSDAAGAAKAHKSVTLALPRAASSNEALAARIRAGVLPPGARIIVRLSNGEIAGSVTPYGVRSGQKALYTIPLPGRAVASGRATLQLELKEEGGATRPPTDQEVEGVELVWVPASK